MTKCKDCGVKLEGATFDVRCPSCKKKNTELRKYKRQHIHRLKVAGLR